MKLLNNKTANGSSPAVNWVGGEGTFAAWGTWNGAQLRLEWSPDGGITWIGVGVVSTLTADAVVGFRLPAGLIRSTLSGVQVGTSISALV